MKGNRQGQHDQHNTYRSPNRKVNGRRFRSATDSKRYMSTSSRSLGYNGVPIGSLRCAVQRCNYRESEMWRSWHFSITFRNCFPLQHKNSNDSYRSDLTKFKNRVVVHLFSTHLYKTPYLDSSDFGTIGTFRFTGTITYLDKSENVENNHDAMAQFVENTRYNSVTQLSTDPYLLALWYMLMSVLQFFSREVLCCQTIKNCIENSVCDRTQSK